MSNRNGDLRTAGAKTAPRELKQERAGHTRRQLLNAAARAFADKGYPAVTLQDIADRAEVTKGAVYFHFVNKEAVAVAVTEEFYTQLPTVAESVMAKQLPPLDAVAEFLMRTAVFLRDNPVAQAGARLQIEHSSVGAPLPPPYITFSGVIESWLQEAAEAGQLPDCVSVPVLTRVLVEVVFGAQHISWVQSDRADIVERMDEIVRVVLRTEPRGA